MRKSVGVWDMQVPKGGGGDRQCSSVGPGGEIAAADKWSLSRNLPLEKRESILLVEHLHHLSFLFMMAGSSSPYFCPILPVTLPPLLH